MLDWLPFPKGWRDTIGLVRWPVLAVLLMVGLGVIYRFAPARRNPCWHFFSPGTIGAATVWLGVSAGFSYYVANFASYDKTYGSLDTIVILMMWLYLSSYIVLVGAELNSEIEQARTGKEEDLDPQASGRPLRRLTPIYAPEPRHQLDEIARTETVVELVDEDVLPCVAARARRSGQREQIGAAGDAGRGAALDRRRPDFRETEPANSSPNPAISFS